MSLANRQKTCAACGRELLPGEQVTVEPLIDPSIRYIVIHWNESTFSYRGPMAKEYNTRDEDIRTPEEIEKEKKSIKDRKEENECTPEE